MNTLTGFAYDTTGFDEVAQMKSDLGVAFGNSIPATLFTWDASNNRFASIVEPIDQFIDYVLFTTTNRH